MKSLFLLLAVLVAGSAAQAKAIVCHAKGTNYEIGVHHADLIKNPVIYLKSSNLNEGMNGYLASAEISSKPKPHMYSSNEGAIIDFQTMNATIDGKVYILENCHKTK